MSDNETKEDSRHDFPVVGIGASAGGLDAVKGFLGGLPDEPEMGFILVMHLSPDRESHLADLLTAATAMPVHTVTEPVEIASGHLYVLSPRTELYVDEDRRLVSCTQPVRDGSYHPIDRLFRSLAAEVKEQSAGIVLSGSGSDGAQGVREINQENGYVLVQDPEEAAFSSMPQAAIRAVPPDLIGSAEELGRRISATIESAGRPELPERAEDLRARDVDVYHRLLARLKSHSGHDFGVYKSPTLLRRIGRRVQIKGLDTLKEYLKYVSERPEELSILYKDLLIPVTSFFRDREVFEHIQKSVVPQLFEEKDGSDQIRVWVPACSTGEEAYSIALLLNEYGARRTDAPDIQLFATDVNGRAVETARDGRYPETISEDVDDRLLSRYFGREDHEYVVNPEIRDQIVFAEHDVLTDPPFARLDLVSCRNLLIYLESEQQKRVLKIIHFALRTAGWMVLGGAESAQVGSNLFRVGNRELSIYRRREASGRPPEFATWIDGGGGLELPDRPVGLRRAREFEPARVHRKLRAEGLGAASVLVDEDYHVLHMAGGVDRFLGLPDGSFPETVLEAARDHVQTALRTALYTSRKEGAESVRRRVPIAGERDGRVTIRVRPVHWEEEQLYLVLFERQPEREEDAESMERDRAAEETIRELEEELEETREQLQVTTEQYETANEELRASNEELLSMNEELQSTTEELETSKEELESMNEEMQTVNEELNQKVEELNQAYADLENLMAATQIPTLFLTEDLVIRRFTSSATEIFNIQDADRGRAIGDLTTLLHYDQLEADARAAFEEGEVIEREVRTTDGRWYMLRLRPYRVSGEVRGTVASFVDVTERQEARTRLERLNEELEERVSERTAELERVQREVLRAADQERYRLGERLHDGLGQELAGMRMMCRSVRDQLAKAGSEASERLRQLEESLERAEAHTRDLAEEIFPVELDDGSLETALETLTSDVREHREMRIQVETGEVPPLTTEARTQIFRIVQEAVLNAAVHGEAATVGIRLEREGDRIRLEVEDDGSGPLGDMAEMKAEGMGIRIMQYRASLLGGVLSIGSGDGSGMHLTCEFPVAAVDGEDE